MAQYGGPDAPASVRCRTQPGILQADQTDPTDQTIDTDDRAENLAQQKINIAIASKAKICVADCDE